MLASDDRNCRTAIMRTSMLRTMCKGKIHRARVTEARLDYTGSITIDEQLMRAADIKPYELVHINNMANAVHWETYAIPGKPGQICLNGCPAHLFEPGDEVIILSLGHFGDSELPDLCQKVVFVDERNAIASVKRHALATEMA
jgi:aspartate 1-decarboxylase